MKRFYLFFAVLFLSTSVAQAIDLDDLKREVENLQDRIEDAEKDVASSGGHRDAAKDRHASIERHLSETKAAINAKEAELNNTITRERELRASLPAAVNAENAQIDEVSRLASSLPAGDPAIIAAVQRLRELSVAKTNIEEDQQEAENEIGDLRSEVQALKLTAARLETEQSDAAKSVQSYEEDIAEEKERINDMRVELRYAKSILNLAQSHDSLEREVKDLRQIANKHEERLDDHEEDIKTLRKRLDEALEKNDDRFKALEFQSAKQAREFAEMRNQIEQVRKDALASDAATLLAIERTRQMEVIASRVEVINRYPVYPWRVAVTPYGEWYYCAN